MTEQELKTRTKRFGLRVIRLVNSLPRSQTGKVIGNQLLRSGTSVGANYRSACRARSSADFISKLSIVIEETDESLYWMEMLVESGIMIQSRMNDIMKEADELVSIFAAAVITTKKRYKKS